MRADWIKLMTPANLAQLFGVYCSALSVNAGALTGIYPVPVIAPGS